MQTAIHSFQKNLFILLLYASAFFGVVTDLAGGLSKTPFYLAFDGLMILLAIFSLSELRGKLLFIVFFIITCIVINLSYSEASIYATLNGSREIVSIVALVIFFNKVFAEGNEDIANDYLEILRKFGFVFLLAQIPVAIVQFIQFGATDAVGGTFGNFGSGVLTFTVICMVYFMHHFTRNISQTLLLFFALLPLFLNETKISFILIPMTILFITIKPNFKNVVVAFGGAAIFFLLFNMYFSSDYQEYDDSASEIFSADFLNDYLMADIYQYDDIPRFTKIILCWRLLSEQTNTFLFGMEYGLFKGTDPLDLSHFGQTYYWLLVGTRPYLFFLLMQGGIMLVTGFLLLIAHINRYLKYMNKFKFYLLAIFLLMMVYNDLFRNHTFALVYLMLVFFANSRTYNEKFVAA